MINYHYQTIIFERLRKHFTQAQIIHLLVNTLGITRQSAYHYLDSKRALSYDAVMKLVHESPATQFLLDVDNPGDLGSIAWQYMNSTGQPIDHLDYMNRLRYFFANMRFDKFEIRLVSFEVPIFYYMYFPALLGFKFFCWSKTVWNNAVYKEKAYRPDDFLSDEFIAISNALVANFSSVRTVEYWSNNMLTNTLRQLHYFKEMNYLGSIKVYNELIHELRQMIELFRQMAAEGKKRSTDQCLNGALTGIYINQIFYANNTYLLSGEDIRLVFTAYDNPNFMFTDNPQIIDKTLAWMDNIQRHSGSLVQCNELDRLRFFERMEFELDEYDQTI